jgi:hypothetical protein
MTARGDRAREAAKLSDLTPLRPSTERRVWVGSLGGYGGRTAGLGSTTGLGVKGEEDEGQEPFG